MHHNATTATGNQRGFRKWGSRCGSGEQGRQRNFDAALPCPVMQYREFLRGPARPGANTIPREYSFRCDGGERGGFIVVVVVVFVIVVVDCGGSYPTAKAASTRKLNSQGTANSPQI